MADKTLIFAGAEAHGLYRKAAGDARWEELDDGLPPMPQARPIAIHPTMPTSSLWARNAVSIAVRIGGTIGSA